MLQGSADDQLRDIGKSIRTQDNLATAEPLFLVQQVDRVFGMDSDYAESYIWIDKHNDGIEADEDQRKSLELGQSPGGESSNWERVYFEDRWEFVTACLTRQAAEDYIKANNHNLVSPRVYTASLYRNKEMIAVRKALAELPEVPATSPLDEQDEVGGPCDMVMLRAALANAKINDYDWLAELVIGAVELSDVVEDLRRYDKGFEHVSDKAVESAVLAASTEYNQTLSGEQWTLVYLTHAWNMFLPLGHPHPDELDDFRRGINDLQRIVGVRRIAEEDGQIRI